MQLSEVNTAREWQNNAIGDKSLQTYAVQKLQYH